MSLRWQSRAWAGWAGVGQDMARQDTVVGRTQWWARHGGGQDTGGQGTAWEGQDTAGQAAVAGQHLAGLAAGLAPWLHHVHGQPALLHLRGGRRMAVSVCVYVCVCVSVWVYL